MLLYFLPGANPNHLKTDGNLRKELAARGLDYLGIKSPAEIVVTHETDLGGVTIVRKVGGVMPDVVAWRDVGVSVECGRGENTSGKSAQPTFFHVGTPGELVPGPSDLARAMIYPGYEIDDAAGRSWTVPVARSPSGQTSLPSDFVFDLQSGQIRQQRKTEFDWLWELSGKLYQHWYANEAMPVSQLAAAAVRILSVNYRIGPAEVNLLQLAGCPLVDTTTAQTITLFCLDNPKLNEQKKSEMTETDGALAATG